MHACEDPAADGGDPYLDFRPWGLQNELAVGGRGGEELRRAFPCCKSVPRFCFEPLLRRQDSCAGGWERCWPSDLLERIGSMQAPCRMGCFRFRFPNIGMHGEKN
jgi:hypothetical protein